MQADWVAAGYEAGDVASFLYEYRRSMGRGNIMLELRIRGATQYMWAAGVWGLKFGTGCVGRCHS